MNGPSVDRIGRWLLLAAALAVAATVVVAIVVMDSPEAQRQTRLDERRVQDLQRLDEAIRAHARHHDALPAALSVVTDRPGVNYSVADPVDGAPYVYEATGPRSYRLCARFATDTARLHARTRPHGGYDWAHAAGRQASTANWSRVRGRSRDAGSGSICGDRLGGRAFRAERLVAAAHAQVETGEPCDLAAGAGGDGEALDCVAGAAGGGPGQRPARGGASARKHGVVALPAGAAHAFEASDAGRHLRVAFQGGGAVAAAAVDEGAGTGVQAHEGQDEIEDGQ
jgi:hypothetical protein